MRSNFGRKVTFYRLYHLNMFWRKWRFSQLTHTEFYRPYPPTPLRVFLQITGAKRKPSIYSSKTLLPFVDESYQFMTSWLTMHVLNFHFINIYLFSLQCLYVDFGYHFVWYTHSVQYSFDFITVVINQNSMLVWNIQNIYIYIYIPFPILFFFTFRAIYFVALTELLLHYIFLSDKVN